MCHNMDDGEGYQGGRLWQAAFRDLTSAGGTGARKGRRGDRTCYDICGSIGCSGWQRSVAQPVAHGKEERSAKAAGIVRMGSDQIWW